MRHLTGLALSLALIAAGCGGERAVDSVPAAKDANDASADPGVASVGASPSSLGDVTTEVRVAPEIAEAWSAVRIEVLDRDTGDEKVFEVPLGGADLLGDSGLVLSAETFVPDFIMDENGIRSRTAEPHNPAVRVVISGDGMEDYRGWLFAAMPEIQAFPHPRYRVLLVEGIPAQSR
jgi:hypothetical protein